MTTIIFIGDSLTEGVGTEENNYITNYPNQVARILGDNYKVVNCGLGGATVMETKLQPEKQYKKTEHFEKGKKAIKEADENGHKIIVSIILGTNDADTCNYGFMENGEEFYNKYKKQFFADYIEIIKELSINCPDFKLIINKPPYSYNNRHHPNFGNLDNIYKMLSEIYNSLYNNGFDCILNDLSIATDTKIMKTEEIINSYYCDKLHFNATGYAYISHFMVDAIKKAEAY